MIPELKIKDLSVAESSRWRQTKATPRGLSRLAVAAKHLRPVVKTRGVVEKLQLFAGDGQALQRIGKLRPRLRGEFLP